MRTNRGYFSGLAITRSRPPALALGRNLEEVRWRESLIVKERGHFRCAGAGAHWRGKLEAASLEAVHLMGLVWEHVGYLWLVLGWKQKEKKLENFLSSLKCFAEVWLFGLVVVWVPGLLMLIRILLPYIVWLLLLCIFILSILKELSKK